ncbi:hypothetical protein MJT46_005182 [Ovis ammon polii x Ovis aries]|nr:hypothetical protein MJT46_005182 [Ovis ammon polii x Ovis aries]
MHGTCPYETRTAPGRQWSMRRRGHRWLELWRDEGSPSCVPSSALLRVLQEGDVIQGRAWPPGPPSVEGADGLCPVHPAHLHILGTSASGVISSLLAVAEWLPLPQRPMHHEEGKKGAAPCLLGKDVCEISWRFPLCVIGKKVWEGATKDMGKMLGGDEEKDPDAAKKEEERREALRQEEEERKAKYAKMEAEREAVRQGIRDKYGIKKKEEREAEAQAALEANSEGSLTRPKKAIPPGCGDAAEEEDESILDTVIKYLPGPLQDIFKK